MPRPGRNPGLFQYNGSNAEGKGPFRQLIGEGVYDTIKIMVFFCRWWIDSCQQKLWNMAGRP